MKLRLKTAYQTGLGCKLSAELSCWTLTKYCNLTEPQFPHLQYFPGLLRGWEEIMHTWHLACLKLQGVIAAAAAEKETRNMHVGGGHNLAGNQQKSTRMQVFYGLPCLRNPK